MSPTVAEMAPLHFSVRLSSLVDVVTILSPRRYNGCCFDFSASELASLDFAHIRIFGGVLDQRIIVVVRNGLEHGIPGFEKSHYSAAVVADLVDQVNRFSYAGVDDASFLVEILVKEGVACPRPAFARSASTVRPFAAE